MKCWFVALFALLGAVCPQCRGSSPQPSSVDAVLAVQDHTGGKFNKSLASLSDRFSASLSGGRFKIVAPEDVMGDNASSLDSTPMARLAELCGGRVLIVVAVDGYSVVSVGSPAMVKALKATMTIQAKCVASGASVRGITRTFVSDNWRASEFDANIDSIHDDLMQKSVVALSREFLDRAAKLTWTVPPPSKVEVAFGCNVVGVDVAIDGVSVGIAGGVGAAPLKVKVFPGVHKLRIAFPFMVPYETQASFQPNSTFMVVLCENAEGRARREQDAVLAQLLDQIGKSGATEETVRRIKARGYGRYLSANCRLLDGVPQVVPAPQDVKTVVK